MTTTISTRGQVVIPAKIRRQRRIKAGDDFEVFAPEGSSEIVLRKIQKQPNEGLAALFRNAPRLGLKIPRRTKETARKPSL